MAEEGVEKRAIRTVLGIEEDGISTSSTFDLVVKDHGLKSGLQYDSVCITPTGNATFDDAPEKMVQVIYTQETQMQGNLKFATVAVCETPQEISSENTVSKIVHLRSSKPAGNKAASSNACASHLETFRGTGYGPKPQGASALCGDESEGVFASDPEALKYIQFGPKSAATTGASSMEEPDGIYASDPEALKYIRFAPKPAATTGESNAEEPDGIYASDPEALKFIRFGPKPAAATIAPRAEEPDGIYASDPEALKYIRFGPKQVEQKTSCTDGIFVSDSEALKCIRFGPFPDASDASKPKASGAIFTPDSEAAGRIPEDEPSTVSKSPATDGEGRLLAQANGIQLKDNRHYSVTVSGHALPDGQQKKFVSVRSSESGGGPTPEEIDNLQVSVETSVSKDGLVEKFIVIE